MITVSADLGVRKEAGVFPPSALHLPHQLYGRDQGFLRVSFADPVRGWRCRHLPRLGCCVTIQSIDCLDTAEMYWSGRVDIKLTVSLGSLGLAPGASRRHVATALAMVQQGLAGNHDAAMATGSAHDSAQAKPTTVSFTPAERKRLAAAQRSLLGTSDVMTASDFRAAVGGDMTAEGFLAAAFGVHVKNLRRGAGDDWSVDGPVSINDDNVTLEGGAISATFKVQGSFYEETDLSAFPFDVLGWSAVIFCKSFSVGLEYNWSCLRSFTEFDVVGLSGDRHQNKHLGETWMPHVCEQGVVPNSAREPEGFVYVRFHSRRNPSAALINVMMPASLSTVIGVVAFRQAQGDVQEHAATDPIAFQTTSLLAIVALKFAFADSLPKGLGYSTMLDRYILGSLTVVVASMLVITYATADELKDASAEWIYLAVFAALHVYFALAALWSWRLPLENAPAPLYDQPHRAPELDATSNVVHKHHFVPTCPAMAERVSIATDLLERETGTQP